MTLADLIREFRPIKVPAVTSPDMARGVGVWDGHKAVLAEEDMREMQWRGSETEMAMAARIKLTVLLLVFVSLGWHGEREAKL